MKALDTHVGSASSLLAFEEFNLDYTGYELDPIYYENALHRLAAFKAAQSNKIIVNDLWGDTGKEKGGLF